MSIPYLGEIRMFAGNFPPRGWALCNGQIMPINQNTALFSLLGTTYGGDGKTTFALPDLRGRVPVHFGSHNGYVSLGQSAGEEAHTLHIQELPAHTHQVNVASTNATDISPKDHVWAKKENSYGEMQFPASSMHAAAISNTGGYQPHNNMQPYLVTNFIIALDGVFPSHN